MTHNLDVAKLPIFKVGCVFSIHSHWAGGLLIHYNVLNIIKILNDAVSYSWTGVHSIHSMVQLLALQRHASWLDGSCL